MQTFKQFIDEAARAQSNAKLRQVKDDIRRLEIEHRRALVTSERHRQTSEDPSLSFDDRRFAQERSKSFASSAKNTEDILNAKRKEAVEMAKRLLSGDDDLNESTN